SLTEAVAAALSPAEPPTGAAGAQGGAPRSRPARAPATGLTVREREVAALIARGLTNRRIGETLVITEGTAASHGVPMLGERGFSSRAKIAAWAATQSPASGPRDGQPPPHEP